MPKRKRIAFVLESEVHQTLKECAAINHHTISSLMRYLVYVYLDNPAMFRYMGVVEDDKHTSNLKA